MAALKDIGEFGFIRRLSQQLRSAPSVVEGVGDDCAVLRVGSRLMLVSCDLFIEDVHFRRRAATPEDIGWKAAMSSLSDIAAMGGEPLFCVVSLACPGDTDLSFLDSVYDGLLDAMSQCGATLVGGDTTKSPAGVILDVTVIGEVVSARYLARKGAQQGDRLVVTGQLGRAAAGLHAAEHGHEAPDLVNAHYRPAARLSEGQWFAAHPAAHAMIDISDGLAQDAGHLGHAAGLGVDIDPARLVIAPDLEAYCQTQSLDPRDFILAGGEDYELALAIDGRQCDEVIAAFRREFQTEISAVGSFTESWHDVRVAGQAIPRGGYDHFQ